MASLIHFTLDPFSRRMRLALGEYRREAELIEELPWQPSADIAALNPAGDLPIYVEDGDTVICGVEALGDYLDETSGASLLSGDARARAEIRRLVAWFDVKFNAEVTGPLLTEKVMKRFFSSAQGGGGPDMTRVRRALAAIRPHLDYVSELADARAWLAGGTLTMADLAAAAHLSAVDYLGDVPWADYPEAKSWYQRLKSRPSFRPLLADALRGLAPSATYADIDF